MPEGRLKKRLEIAGLVIAVVTFFSGVALYIYERVGRVTLSVAQPLVIEFRCNSSTFDAARCFTDGPAQGSVLSLSAALALTASSPGTQSVSIDSVAARVSIPWGHENRLLPDGMTYDLYLVAFWTGDMTGGEGRFQQVVAESMRGGTSATREYWMMPLPREPCGAQREPDSEDREEIMPVPCGKERQDFMTWKDFVIGGLKAIKAAEESGAPPPEITVDIEVIGDPSFLWLPYRRHLSCSLFLRRSAELTLKRTNDDNKGNWPGYLTLPCRQADSSSALARNSSANAS